jgi:CDP-glucose 4,6-dehydratase
MCIRDSPYSASKGCAELIFNAYLNSYFSQSLKQNRTVGAASARAGNVIGGGDWGVDRLVPDCIRALSRQENIVIRSPHAVRPWQHVLEPLCGYLQLGAALWRNPHEYSGAWNFGPESRSHLTVAEMADRLVRYWGEGSWNDLSDPQAPHEAKLLKLNCDKAHSELNWQSVLTIDECLQMTCDWYKQYYSEKQNTGMYGLCVDQIRAYMETKGQKSTIPDLRVVCNLPTYENYKKCGEQI